MPDSEKQIDRAKLYDRYDVVLTDPTAEFSVYPPPDIDQTFRDNTEASLTALLRAEGLYTAPNNKNNLADPSDILGDIVTYPTHTSARLERLPRVDQHPREARLVIRDRFTVLPGLNPYLYSSRPKESIFHIYGITPPLETFVPKDADVTYWTDKHFNSSFAFTHAKASQETEGMHTELRKLQRMAFGIDRITVDDEEAIEKMHLYFPDVRISDIPESPTRPLNMTIEGTIPKNLTRRRFAEAALAATHLAHVIPRKLSAIMERNDYCFGLVHVGDDKSKREMLFVLRRDDEYNEDYSFIVQPAEVYRYIHKALGLPMLSGYKNPQTIKRMHDYLYQSQVIQWDDLYRELPLIQISIPDISDAEYHP